MTMKPFKGKLLDAEKVSNPSMGGVYVYIGVFDGHPKFHGRHGHTSQVVREFRSSNPKVFIAETLNSQYEIHLKEDE